jgi:hypothetical protein
VPALSSSLISPALEQIAGLPAGDRELLASGQLSLLEHLARVPDPRKRRGVRHSLSSVLAAAIAAVLTGAQSFTAIGEWIADAPPPVLASLGIRRDPLTRRFQPPGEATIRRILESVDAGVLDTEVGAWLSARVQAARTQTGPVSVGQAVLPPYAASASPHCHVGSPPARIILTRACSGPVRSCSPTRTARSPEWMT